MLDLVGYTAGVDLAAGTIVEPGCGDGAILSRIVPRLLLSAERHGRTASELVGAVRAYEIDPVSVESARAAVQTGLKEWGVDAGTAAHLAATWVVEADFLLQTPDLDVSWVVGNPPYIRVEESDPEAYSEYRDRWATMAGRADVYIGFFEAGLSLLSGGGRLCFICADRWMHNQYGANLRRHIIENFALTTLIEVHEAPVFDVSVSAYPAITVIVKSEHSRTALATATAAFDAKAAGRLTEWLAEGTPFLEDETFSASVLDGQFRADASWPSGPPQRLKLIADLEARLPSLTEVGIRVGVGMATGSDKVYIVSEAPPVEARFLKPAVGPADLRGGAIQWLGRHIISPWDGSELADLTAFPGLAAYLAAHSEALKSRYVGKRNPSSWWRTIDRPPADEYTGEKLLVADINDRIEPVLDVSGYWPLHSAYFITSEEWDLKVLGGYLLSDVAGAFVTAYSVKMANGHLRVSAQYLKRIRLPRFADVDESLRTELRRAFSTRDRDLASRAARMLVRH